MRARTRTHTHTRTHTSRLFCFSLTLQWSSQMYAYKGTHTLAHAHTHTHTHSETFAHSHTHRHTHTHTHTPKARTSQMRLLSTESVSVHITQYLTPFSASDTHITAGCVQSLTNLLSQTLCQPCLWAPRHDWSTHCVAVNGWERRGGPAVSGTGPQMTCRRFGANLDGRCAHLWPH